MHSRLYVHQDQQHVKNYRHVQYVETSIERLMVNTVTKVRLKGKAETQRVPGG